MILIQAKFKGKDSLGFKNGEFYYLNLEVRSLYSSWRIEIQTNMGTYPNYTKLRCEYGSIKTFLQNWIPVKINREDSVTDKEKPTLQSIKISIREEKIDKIIC